MRFKGLTSLRSSVKPIRMAAFDVETYNRNRDVSLISLYDGKKFFDFFDRESFKDFLLTNKAMRNCQLYASNLMFDFFSFESNPCRALRQWYLVSQGGQLKMAKSYGIYGHRNFYHPKEVKRMKDAKEIISKETFPITMVDTLNHFPASVEQMGKILKLPKLEHPSFFGKKPRNRLEWSTLIDYCHQDTRISYDFMRLVEASYNSVGHNLKPTVSGSAFDGFRRNYLKAWIPQEPRGNIILSYNAYYGGRTEAFKRGLFDESNYGHLYYYDVNSLYPYCLANFPYPIIKSHVKVDKGNMAIVESFIGYGRFKLKVPDCYIPYLPYRDNKKLLFPMGTISGYYDFFSIREAINKGYEVLEIGDCVYYQDSCHPFKSFILSLYKKRREYKTDKNPLELGIKLLMNSFYGKFGFNPFNKDGYVASGFAESSMIVDDELLEDICYYNIDPDKAFIPSYCFPIFALLTTAYARTVLYRYLQKTEDKVIYCDTDSIMSNRQMETGSELGELKLENQLSRLCVVKPKFYCYEDIEANQCIKIKGVKLRELNLDVNKVLRMLKDDQLKFKQNRFIKFRTGLKHNKMINSVESFEKVLSTDEDKRIWDKDNFTEAIQDSRPIFIASPLSDA